MTKKPLGDGGGLAFSQLSSLVKGAGALTSLAGLCALPVMAQPSVIAHWSFDEIASGTTFTDSTGNYDATLNSAGVTLATGTQGTDFMFGGGAASFDGNDAYATTASLLGEIGSSSFTIAAWANLGENRWGNQVLSDWSGNPANSFLFGFNGGDSNPIWALNKSDGSGNVPGGFGGDGTLSLDTWYHVAYVFDRASDGSSATISFYVDGTLFGTPTTLTSAEGYTGTLYESTSGTTWIGQKQDNQHGWLGTMDELWVFNGALSVPEINSLMSGNAIPEPSSLALLTLGLGMGGLRVWRKRRGG